MMLAHALRRCALTHLLAYFHHIPFPSPDIFETLPWRTEVLRALMQFDVLGFQTVRDRRNFISCLRRCLHGARVARVGDTFLAPVDDRSVSIGTYPISIDYDAFEYESAQPRTADAVAEIRRSFGDAQLILGIARLDYTKGTPERLIAFEHLIETKPEWRAAVTMLQIVVP